MWKIDCICLPDKEQSWKPCSEEKIELARMGLGQKEVFFQSSGDVEHIHRSLLNAFPVLEECGGYKPFHLTKNSHRMVEVEGPKSGMTVAYLKDILNQAKLFVRPLQKDITGGHEGLFHSSGHQSGRQTQLSNLFSIDQYKMLTLTQGDFSQIGT